MSTDIHRLLDNAFVGVVMTPEAQDLKEEMRANLLARVAELEASGIDPGDAARRAIDELGDVRELLDGSGPASAATAPAAVRWEADLARHRVRPAPGFVVRVVIWSLLAVVGITLTALGAAGVLSLPAGVLVLVSGVAATGIALVVGDSLSQTTTTNHPMPRRRASGYALGAFLVVWGLGLAALVMGGALPVWVVVLAVIGVVAAVILFAFLGATQTNRHKAWTRQLRDSHPGDRFEQEPETAARFGIYTLAIWVVALGVFVAVGFTIGWWWAALAILGGFAAMMLLLARMLFGGTPR